MNSRTTEEMYALLTPDNQALIDKIIQGFQDRKNVSASDKMKENAEEKM